MAKKSGARRAKGSAAGTTSSQEGDNDAASITSTGTTLSSLQGLAEFEETVTDEFQTAIDDLFEKRSATRERAWAKLVVLLSADVKVAECESNEATLVSRCLNAWKKGTNLEIKLAAETFGLFVVTVGEPNDRLFSEVRPILEKLALEAKNPAARNKAIDALALTCYVAAEEEGDTLEVMGLLQRIGMKGGPAPVRAAALRCWSFLLTTVHVMGAAGSMSELQRLLGHNDVDVRAAAGEAIVLLCDFLGLLRDDVEVGPGEDEAEGDAMSVASGSSTYAEELDGVMDRMKDLATNRGDKDRRSKKDRAALRSSFRALCNTLQDGIVREVKIKLQFGDILCVDTYNGVLTLNFFRRFLAGGFQVHLQRNPFLHSVFNFSPIVQRPERLTALEKRAYKSPSSFASKARTQGRKQERAAKGQAMGSMQGVW